MESGKIKNINKEARRFRAPGVPGLECQVGQEYVPARVVGSQGPGPPGNGKQKST